MSVMLTILIVSLIAAGIFVVWKVILTFKKLRDRIKEKLAVKNAKKVAVTDLKELIDNYENKISLDSLKSLEKISDEGYTDILATVDDDDKVSEVELIQDENPNIDEEVEEFINKTGEGMIVIEG